MRRPPAVAALLLVALFAACVQTPSDPVTELREIFGDAAVTESNGTVRIVGPVLEGRFTGQPSWLPFAGQTLEVPTIELPKQDPGPQGGGGTTKPLELPPGEGAVLEVRFNKTGRLGGYQARWSALSDPTAPFNWSAPAPADEPFAVPVAKPGPVFVAAQLLGGDVLAANVTTPFVATLGAKWTVESAVRPVKPLGAPAPTNYEAMADKFPLEVPAAGASIKLTTAFRGTWSPDKGADVDLELDQPDGKPAKCQGSGGGLNPAPNNVQHASETIELDDLTSGVWTVRVGALRITAGCVDMTAYYHNAGMVPYTLTVALNF